MSEETDVRREEGQEDMIEAFPGFGVFAGNETTLLAEPEKRGFEMPGRAALAVA